MANINAALPTSIAIPFHPPTETLHHDNLVKPVIPKAEIIASYTKLREDGKEGAFSGQAHSIIQDDNNQNSDEEKNADQQQQQQQSTAEQRRLKLFRQLAGREEINESYALDRIMDFKLVLTVIDERYKSAVTPIPESNVDFLL